MAGHYFYYGHLQIWLWIPTPVIGGWLQPDGTYRLKASVYNTSNNYVYTITQLRIVIRDWCKDWLKFYTDTTYQTPRPNNRYDTGHFSYLPKKYKIFEIPFKNHLNQRVWGMQKFFDTGVYCVPHRLSSKWRKLYPNLWET